MRPSTESLCEVHRAHDNRQIRGKRIRADDRRQRRDTAEFGTGPPTARRSRAGPPRRRSESSRSRRQSSSFCCTPRLIAVAPQPPAAGCGRELTGLDTTGESERNALAPVLVESSGVAGGRMIAAWVRRRLLFKVNRWSPPHARRRSCSQAKFSVAAKRRRSFVHSVQGTVTTGLSVLHPLSLLVTRHQ